MLNGLDLGGGRAIFIKNYWIISIDSMVLPVNQKRIYIKCIKIKILSRWDPFPLWKLQASSRQPTYSEIRVYLVFRILSLLISSLQLCVLSLAVQQGSSFTGRHKVRYGPLDGPLVINFLINFRFLKVNWKKKDSKN